MAETGIKRALIYWTQLFPQLNLLPNSVTAENASQSSPLNEAIENIARGWNSADGEYDYDLEFEGTIPEEMQGTLFRNGPGLLEVYGTPLVHAIDGDGMYLMLLRWMCPSDKYSHWVCSVSFDGQNQKIHFRNKFVRTKEFVDEHKAKQAKYRGMMGTLPPNWEGSKFKNPSNTNSYYWGGKLLSVWESGLPYELNPKTLETIGATDLDGVLKNCLAAHFRYDPELDVLVSFAFKLSLSKQCELTIYEWDRDFKLIKQKTVRLQDYYYAHDLLITKNWYIFHQSPFYNVTPENIQAMLQGKGPGQLMHYYPEIPSQMILIPRNGNGEVRYFATKPFHIYHHINASEKGNKIHFASVCFGEKFTMECEYGVMLSNASVAPGNVFLFDVDLEKNTMTTTLADNSNCEFPTININWNAKEGWRYGYLMGSDEKYRTIPFQDVIKFDRFNQKREVWSARKDHGVIGEPVFVPRPQAVEEDDGWIIITVYYCQEHKTAFVILDAKDLGKGPIAKAHLKHHTPYGFHQTWCDQIF